MERNANVAKDPGLRTGRSSRRVASAWLFARAVVTLRGRGAALGALLVLLAWTLGAERAAAQAGFIDDLSTPRRAMSVFVEASNRQDWDTALQVLDVSTQASAERRKRAQDLAVQLDYVLSRRTALDPDVFSDQVTGDPADGAETETVAVLTVDNRKVSILLTRLDNPTRWVFSRGTLARVPELYEQYGPGPLEARMPPSLRREVLGLAHWQWLGLAIAIVGALALGRLGVSLAQLVVRRVKMHAQGVWDEQLVRGLRRPALLLLALFAFMPLGHLLALPANAWATTLHTVKALGIVAMCWMGLRALSLVSRTVELRALSLEGNGGHSAVGVRGVRTRVRVLRRVVSWMLILGSAALLLMQFEEVRAVGVSLLASAGMAGIVLGLAAQRTLGSLLAGIQISISQPIRIGDEVIVEGEFGVIEEITLTYVVVKVWDERRMIVPIMRFLEQPFQNWTKVSPELHGTVMLFTNFTLPVDELRRELDRQLEANEAWDGRTKTVAVTDLQENAMVIRVLVSAANAGTLFGLRCQLREGLTAWLTSFEGGRHLPRNIWAAGSAEHDPAQTPSQLARLSRSP